jgi:hypothetical protein
MSLPVSFSRPARAELVEAARWYEARSQNLGVEFVSEIERCVALVANQVIETKPGFHWLKA